jgi:microcin C transport system ATP-binding protein
MTMTKTNVTPLISVDDLSVDFRGGGKVTHAVRNVSFDIGDAETVALVGESGSGKTVTALSILKLLPYPSASHPSGKIRFKGEDMLTLPSNLPGADDVAQPAAHHRAASGRGAEDSPRAI